mgnify:CR=1 FL=1
MITNNKSNEIESDGEISEFEESDDEMYDDEDAVRELCNQLGVLDKVGLTGEEHTGEESPLHESFSCSLCCSHWCNCPKH